jgi:hypothetical protein
MQRLAINKKLFQKPMLFGFVFEERREYESNAMAGDCCRYPYFYVDAAATYQDN